jgi:hypothetical protein
MIVILSEAKDPRISLEAARLASLFKISREAEQPRQPAATPPSTPANP